MKVAFSLWLLIFSACCLRSFAQSTFMITEDTVVTEACTGNPVLFDTIRMYNQGNQDVDLNWDLVKFVLPQGGGGFLIIDPAQYPGFTLHHHVLIHSSDSSQIIFHVWPDTLNAGDSVIWQLHLYDPADTTNLDTLVTAIVVCPLSSAAHTVETNLNISVYPNPFNATATIDLGDEFQNAAIAIHDLSGRLLRKILVTNKQMVIERGGLPSGIYIMRIRMEPNVSIVRKLVITD